MGFCHHVEHAVDMGFFRTCMFRVEHECSTCPNMEKCHVNMQHLLLMPGVLSPSLCMHVQVVSISSQFFVSVRTNKSHHHHLTCTSVWATSSDCTDLSLRGCCSEGPELAATSVLVHNHQNPRKVVQGKSLSPSLFHPATLARVDVWN